MARISTHTPKEQIIDLRFALTTLRNALNHPLDRDQLRTKIRDAVHILEQLLDSDGK